MAFIRAWKQFFAVAFVVIACLCPAPPIPHLFGVEISEARGGSSVYVHGYFRRNGTYVSPHYRSAPDGNFQNNWSTKGNVDPYTGRSGTRVSPPTNYGGDVYVEGYYRRNGTYVQPHYRSAPDGDPSNNWSSRGNVNPYTGSIGTRDPEDEEASPDWSSSRDLNTDGDDTDLSRDDGDLSGDEGDSESETSDEYAVPSAPVVPTWRPSSEDRFLIAVQTALIWSGDDPGPVDGVAGPKTRSAIRSYMTRRHLEGSKASAVLARLADDVRKHDSTTADLLQYVATRASISGK